MEKRVEATSKRGKQLIAEHGDTWHVGIPVRMQCFDLDTGVRVESLDGSHVRNVRLAGDKALRIMARDE